MLEIKHINPHLVLAFLDLGVFSQQFQLSEKREIERNGALFTIRNLLKSNTQEIAYDAYGKPFLPGSNTHMSISHSHKWLVIVLNEKEETGVDIELQKEKIKSIAPKFCSTDELTFASTDVLKLTVIWAAKESVYKLYGKRSIDFKSQLTVDPFGNDRSGQVTVTLKLPNATGKYLLAYEEKQEYALTYVLNELK